MLIFRRGGRRRFLRRQIIFYLWLQLVYLLLYIRLDVVNDVVNDVDNMDIPARVRVSCVDSSSPQFALLPGNWGYRFGAGGPPGGDSFSSVIEPSCAFACSTSTPLPVLSRAVMSVPASKSLPLTPAGGLP